MQKIIRPLHFVGVCVLALAAAILFVWYTTNVTLAGVTSDRQNNLEHQKNFDFFVATTTTATSTNSTDTSGMDFKGAKKATFYFSRGGATGANTGSSKFEVEVSPDGTNWYDFNRLYLVDSSKTATSTVWITAATSTVIASMDIDYNAFQFVRCQVVELTDGEHTCSATVQY